MIIIKQTFLPSCILSTLTLITNINMRRSVRDDRRVDKTMKMMHYDVLLLTHRFTEWESQFSWVTEGLQTRRAIVSGLKSGDEFEGLLAHQHYASSYSKCSKVKSQIPILSMIRHLLLPFKGTSWGEQPPLSVSSRKPITRFSNWALSFLRFWKKHENDLLI